MNYIKKINKYYWWIKCLNIKRFSHISSLALLAMVTVNFSLSTSKHLHDTGDVSSVLLIPILRWHFVILRLHSTMECRNHYENSLKHIAYIQTQTPTHRLIPKYSAYTLKGHSPNTSPSHPSGRLFIAHRV